MTQEKLSELADISVSTLKKIEATPESEFYLSRPESARKLARALRVHIKSLSDENASRIGSSTNELNYELIELRYGVTREWLHEYAPLMFAVLADQATKHLKGIAKKIDSHLDNLLKISGFVGDSFQESIFAARNNRTIASALAVDEILADSESKIVMKDVPHMFPNTIEGELSNSLFSDDYQPIPAILQFLIHKGRHWDPKSEARHQVPAPLINPCKDFGQISLVDGEFEPQLIASVSALEKLIGGSSMLLNGWDSEEHEMAVLALTEGFVRVADIPPDLMSTDPHTTAQRQTWLVEQFKAGRAKKTPFLV